MLTNSDIHIRIDLVCVQCLKNEISIQLRDGQKKERSGKQLALNIFNRKKAGEVRCN